MYHQESMSAFYELSSGFLVKLADVDVVFWSSCWTVVLSAKSFGLAVSFEKIGFVLNLLHTLKCMQTL